jgi:ABC-2 type transport system permease protein
MTDTLAATPDVEPAPGNDAAHSSPSSRRTLGLIIRRETTTRFRSRVFKIMTTIFLVIIVAGIGLDATLNKGPSQSTVGFLPADAAVAAELTSAATAAGVRISAVTIPDAATGEAEVRAGKLDAAVVATTPTGFDVVVKRSLDDVSRAVLTSAARQRALDTQIATLGGNQAAVNAAIAAAGVHLTVLAPPRLESTSRIALGVVTGILLYISLLISGPLVAQGVVEEKSSRVVELLLATVRPWQLMAGKVIGIGAVALSQLVLYAAVGVPLALATGVLHLPASVAVGSALVSLVWFVLGFCLYALLFAAFGALVSRQEDVAGVTAPLMMLIIIPYVIGVSVLPSNPHSTLLAVLSVIPVSAPLIMPMRVAVGAAAGWQIAIAIALAAVTIVGLVRLTGRIYAGAIRRSGSRVSLRDALRAG